MKTPSKWTLAVLAGLALGPMIGSALSAPVGDNVVPQIEPPSLKKTLESVLLARRPEEFAFIEQVVALVDDGTLPRSLVDSTLQWTRKKKPRRPLQYFHAALRVRAKAIDVDLPEITGGQGVAGSKFQ